MPSKRKLSIAYRVQVNSQTNCRCRLTHCSCRIIAIFILRPGQALHELGKEKTSQKAAENNTQQFLKSLQNIESKLSEQINYLTQVSTGQPHEGSGYASAKVLQMAWHRIQHARTRVRELDESKNKYLQAASRQHQNHLATATLSGPAGTSTAPTANSSAAASASQSSNTS